MLDTSRHANGTVVITIARAPVNAFSIALIDAIAAALDALAAEPETRVIIVRAEGRGFCAGGDVKEVQALPGFAGILGHGEGSLRAVQAILNCAVPVVFAVHGYCVGIGVLLAGAADIVIAAERTRFVLAEIDNGATAGAILALKLLPEKRVRAAMMTADPVFAEDLHTHGSVYAVVAENDLADASIRLAATIAAKNPVAMRRLKRSLHVSTRASDIEAVYRAELSFTYELNMIGAAATGRDAFITGARKSYLDPTL